MQSIASKWYLLYKHEYFLLRVQTHMFYIIICIQITIFILTTKDLCNATLQKKKKKKKENLAS